MATMISYENQGGAERVYGCDRWRVRELPWWLAHNCFGVKSNDVWSIGCIPDVSVAHLKLCWDKGAPKVVLII